MKNLSLTYKIIISVVACLTIGFLSGMATTDSIATWYVTLNKPFFNPPNWIFGPVWTLLYAMMGVAAALIWHEGLEKKGVKRALTIFVIQLGLNAWWSILFFGSQNIFAALLEIKALWLVIFLCIYEFYQIKETAAYLMIPYILWVSFATLLNSAIWMLN